MSQQQSVNVAIIVNLSIRFFFQTVKWPMVRIYAQKVNMYAQDENI